MRRIGGAARAAVALKGFQDRLGQWHDWQVLAHHVCRVQGRLPVDDPHVADLTTLLSTLEDRCRALHAEFMAHREDLLALCDAIALDAQPRPQPTSK